jgi:hypothetical protein
MRAYKGLVQNGKIILAEGVDLPDGTVVTVTVGEAELMRAKLRSALKRNVRRRSKGGMRPRGMPTLT